MNNFSWSEPAVTSRRFSVDLFWGKVPPQGGPFPSPLEWVAHGLWFGLSSGGGAGEWGQEEGGVEDLPSSSFPAGGCRLAATSAQGSLSIQLPSPGSNDVRPKGGNSTVVTSSQVPHHPLLISLNPAPSFEHNLFIQSFSDYSV